MELILREETKLVIGQRMYQSLNFLQMGAEELDECLNEMCMENPLLEKMPPKEQPNVKIRYSMSSGRIRKQNEFSDLPIPEKCRRTLRSALIDQTMTLDISEEQSKAVNFVIINLDKRGYFPAELRQSKVWKKAPAMFEEALKIVRSLEPAGVGAESLSDCLCVQLERFGLGDTPAYTICSKYIDHLLKNHINHIAKAMGVPETEIIAAKKVIAELTPIPSNGFDNGEDISFAIPDVEIEVDGDEIILTSCDRYMPSYQINSFYSEMANNEDLSETDREYFRSRMSEAKWALNCVERRQSTLLRCAAEIAEEQKAFFSDGVSAIHPCSMRDIADRLGIHQSTVSRTVKGKYISCRWGVFPMSKFFANEVCGETQDDILTQIKKIIDREDPKKPLSDSAICKKLADRGYDIARRTVAKYRDLAMIPPATGRKVRE